MQSENDDVGSKGGGTTTPSVGGEPILPDEQTWEDVTLDEATQAMIGRRLRDVYDAIVHEPVPDSLLQLLDELERKEQGR